MAAPLALNVSVTPPFWRLAPAVEFVTVTLPVPTSASFPKVFEMVEKFAVVTVRSAELTVTCAVP